MLKVRYIIERLKEPGSLRSLAFLLFVIKGWTIDTVILDQYVDAALVLLGLISFLLPEGYGKTKQAEQVVEAAQETVAAAAKVAETSNTVVDKVQDVVQTTNTLIDFLRRK